MTRFTTPEELITKGEELQHLKENVIKLVKDHKDHCHDSECGVSLYYVRKLAEKAGVIFTDDEKRYFM